VKLGFLDRFEAKFSPEPNSGCWLWFGAVSNGYGYFSIDSKRDLAHRVAYRLYNGSIPDGLELDHLCRMRCCVNPDHLEPVTRGENIRRGLTGETARQRQLMKTHCPQGHPFSGENLYISPSGGRACRICFREKGARYRARKRQERRA
jgi:hypothetical protein